MSAVSPDRHLQAIIIGGGIGGLTAALSLIDAGIDVHVFEQTSSFGAVGAGIQVSPNAARVFEHLGLGSALAATAVLPVALESRDWQDGRLLGSYAVNGESPQFGAPHYLIYRADLVTALVAAMPDSSLNLNARCVAIEQAGEIVTARFADGLSATADFVVAADGIHSVVRTELFGPDRPTFSGTVAYRGIVAADQVAHLDLPNTSTKWWGPTPKHHLVHYYIGGRQLVNVVSIIPEDDWATESWTTPGDVADVIEAFKGYHAPIPDLVASLGDVHKWALYDRPPLDSWTVGRITLLGDACHPMVPFMAQGAAMAIEDAAVLGRCLRGRNAAEVPGALLTYDATRRQRTTRMQLGSRADTSSTWGSREWVYGYDAYSEPLGPTP